MTELKTNCERFDSALYALPERLSSVLGRLPVFIRSSAYEIRLRAGGPVCITGEMGFYVSEQCEVSTSLPKKPLSVTSEELREVLLRITEGSVYTRTDEINEGYLSMRFGGRAGICGNFTANGICKLTSVNIRIPRQVIGCAEKLVEKAKEGMLIAGPPGSGKTTLLRDLVRTLSYEGKRVCVVDTRGEICGKTGEEGLDVGPNTDVIVGKTKAQGVEIALRTMFPDYVAFDEVGNGRELELIGESFYSGVRILTTAHAATVEDILARGVTRQMLEGQVGYVALLSNKPGGRMDVFGHEEVKKLA